MKATSTLPDLSRAMTKSGFGIVEGLLSLSDIFLIDKAISHSALPRTKAGIRHAMREPAIADLSRDPRLLSLARQVLGRSAFPYRATLFDKSPDANWLVVWHQDTALPLEHRET